MLSLSSSSCCTSSPGAQCHALLPLSLTLGHTHASVHLSQGRTHTGCGPHTNRQSYTDQSAVYPDAPHSMCQICILSPANHRRHTALHHPAHKQPHTDATYETHPSHPNTPHFITLHTNSPTQIPPTRHTHHTPIHRTSSPCTQTAPPRCHL